MKRWQKGLLISVLWLALVIGAGMLHTEVFLAGKITPEQDFEISRRYGRLCGMGLVLIWLMLYLPKQARR